jgi:hypothetical protein
VVLLAAAVVAGGVLWWQGRSGQSNFGATAYEHTKAILEFGPRPPESVALEKVLGYLQSQLERDGWVVQRQPFERSTAAGHKKFCNLRARFPAGEWERPIKGILAAHVDSKLYKNMVFLGADDAASACAAILVIASHLARNEPELASQLELVFFDGEEAFGENITLFDGLYGSRYYASDWRTRPNLPAFGMVLDMIGHKNLRFMIPSDTPPALKDALFAAARAEKAEKHFKMAPGPVLDDHVPLNLAGIPTVDMLGDFTIGGWWHTPADSLDLISPDSLDTSIRVALRFLRDRLKAAK